MLLLLLCPQMTLTQKKNKRLLTVYWLGVLYVQNELLFLSLLFVFFTVGIQHSGKES